MSQSLNRFATQGDAVSISVRSGSMIVSKEKPASVAFNTFQGTIEKDIYLGDTFDYEVRVNDTVLWGQGAPNERFEVNQKVYISFGEEAPGICCFNT
jgi:hypothetical protein